MSKNDSSPSTNQPSQSAPAGDSVPTTGDDYSAPVAAGIDPTRSQPDTEPPIEQPHKASPEGTAIAMVVAFNAGCKWHSYALSEQEAAALREDLLPVLEKYDVPEFRYAPELALIATTANIVIPRIKYKAEQARDERIVPDDSIGTGQEGLGEVRPIEETDLSPTENSRAASDFLP